MLVLSRKHNESIMIGDDVRVTVLDIRSDKIRLGVSAPRSIEVHRQEVYESIKEANRKLQEAATEDEHEAGIESDCGDGYTPQHRATDGLSYFSTESME